MKDKAYDPARHNEQSPAPGFASVNTHNPTDGETEETAETLFDRNKEKPEPSEAAPGEEGLRQGEQDA